MTKPDPVRDEDGALRELAEVAARLWWPGPPRPPSSRRAGLRTCASSAHVAIVRPSGPADGSG